MAQAAKLKANKKQKPSTWCAFVNKFLEKGPEPVKKKATVSKDALKATQQKLKKSITASLNTEIEKQMLEKLKKDGKRLSLVKVGAAKEEEQKVTAHTC